MANTNSIKNPAYISDVASYFYACSDTFGQLEAILMAIEKQSETLSSVHKLAGAGVYIARDYESNADSWREEIEREGVRGKEQKGDFRDTKVVVGGMVNSQNMDNDEANFQATILLNRAIAAVDLLFTMSVSNKLDELCSDSLTNSLDAVLSLMAEAKKLIIDGGPGKSQMEVQHA